MEEDDYIGGSGLKQRYQKEHLFKYQMVSSRNPELGADVNVFNLEKRFKMRN